MSSIEETSAEFKLARLLALVASAYVSYACIWGLVYRKFFFDMLRANLGPTGIIPNENINGLIFVTEKTALLQILVELLSLFSLVLHYPIKFFSGFKRHKLRIGILYLTGTLALCVYQAVDGGFYMFISATIYLVLLYIHKPPRNTSDSSFV